MPTLLELRKRRGLKLVQAAAALQLGPDVWKKFETGMILPDGLQEFQIGRLAAFFGITPLTFRADLKKSADQIALAQPMMCSRDKYNGSTFAHQSSPYLNNLRQRSHAAKWTRRRGAPGRKMEETNHDP